MATRGTLTAQQRDDVRCEIARLRAENMALRERAFDRAQAQYDAYRATQVERAYLLSERLRQAHDLAEEHSFAPDFIERLGQLIVEAGDFAEYIDNRLG